MLRAPSAAKCCLESHLSLQDECSHCNWRSSAHGKSEGFKFARERRETRIFFGKGRDRGEGKGGQEREVGLGSRRTVDASHTFQDGAAVGFKADRAQNAGWQERRSPVPAKVRGCLAQEVVVRQHAWPLHHTPISPMSVFVITHHQV